MSASIDELLTEGQISVEGRLVDASNATLFCSITLGESQCNAIYKPISGERPLWDFESGNLASRERAAYLISEIGKFHHVPLTILREGPFGEGAVQLWVEIDESIDLSTFFRSEDQRLRSVALFDAIINNTDRKIGHLLPTEEGHLFICDHGVTFHSEDKLRTVLWQWAGEPLNQSESEQLRALFLSLHSEESDELRTLINGEEFEQLLVRITRLIEEGFPHPSTEWPAIPWPPF